MSKLKHHAKRLLSKNKRAYSVVTHYYRRYCAPDVKQLAVIKGMASMKQVLGMLDKAQVRSAAISKGALAISFRDGTAFNVSTRENAISGLLLTEGGYEEAETRFLTGLIKKGWNVVDAGANFGWYSIHFSKSVGRTGRVFAFEPIPDTFAELSANIRLNDCGNVSLNRCALGNKSGTITFRVPEAQLGSGAASEFHTEGKQVEVNMAKLDDFILKNRITRLDLIKADVEGGEFNLLQGAKKTLETLRPDLFIEIFPPHLLRFGHTPSDIFGFLSSLGYSAFYIGETGGLVPTKGLVSTATNYYFSSKRR